MNKILKQKKYTKAFVIIGLILGLIYTVYGLYYDLSTTGLNYGTALASLSMIVLPLVGLLLGVIIDKYLNRKNE